MSLNKKATISSIIGILFLGINCVYSQKVDIPIKQIDPRFTISAKRYFSTLGGSEEYWYYIKNNTSDKYSFVVDVTLNLACVGERSYTLGVNKVVILPPNGNFTPDDDWVHVLVSGADNFKNCRLKDGANSYTLFKGLTYTISNVKNITEEERNKAKAKDSEKTQVIETPASKKADLENKQPPKKGGTEPMTTVNNPAINLSEKVLVNGQYVQVFKQNGIPYVKRADGSIHQTTETAYSQILQVSDNLQKKTQPQVQQQPQQKTADETMAEIKRNQEQIEQQNAKIEQDLIRAGQYFSEALPEMGKAIFNKYTIYGFGITGLDYKKGAFNTRAFKKISFQLTGVRKFVHYFGEVAYVENSPSYEVNHLDNNGNTYNTFVNYRDGLMLNFGFGPNFKFFNNTVHLFTDVSLATFIYSKNYNEESGLSTNIFFTPGIMYNIKKIGLGIGIVYETSVLNLDKEREGDTLETSTTTYRTTATLGKPIKGWGSFGFRVAFNFDKKSNR
ncbi:MAG: hypothetical protein RL596_1403 [Bacteroidota bacterium]